MIEIKDAILNIKIDRPSARGGEKNFIVQQFLGPINASRKAQNARNYRLNKKTSPSLSKEEYKKTRAYLPHIGHGRLVRELKRAYGDWKDISEHTLYELLSICKQSDNFNWTFWARLKKQRENRKGNNEVALPQK